MKELYSYYTVNDIDPFKAMGPDELPPRLLKELSN